MNLSSKRPLNPRQPSLAGRRKLTLQVDSVQSETGAVGEVGGGWRGGQRGTCPQVTVGGFT